jgi:tetratricopeptide (TPR) repeat protein
MRRGIVLGAILALVPVASPAQTAQRAAVTTASPEALVLYQNAVECLENLELSKARPLLDEAIQKDPGFAMAYIRRAQAGGAPNVGQVNIDKAVALADKVSPRERAWILMVKASNERDLAATKRYAEELLTLSPGDKHAALFAGNFYSGLGDDAKAKECYESATSIDPAYAAAFNQLGYLNVRLRNFPAAEAAFKKYIAARPASPNPYDSYAEMLLTLGRYDDSIAQYNAALAKDPAFTGSLVGLGHNYTFKGEYTKARDAYKRLADLGGTGNQMTALFWTGISYLHEARTDDALKAIDQRRELAITEGLLPQAVVAHFEQSTILLEARRAAEIPPHLAESEKLLAAAKIPEGRRSALRRQLEMVAGMAAAQTKDVPAASAQLDKLKAGATPGSPEDTSEIQTLAGMIEFYQGRYDAAVAQFKKCDPEDVYALFYAGEALRLKGDRAGAAAMYKKVMDSNQNSLFYGLVRPRAMKELGP